MENKEAYKKKRDRHHRKVIGEFFTSRTDLILDLYYYNSLKWSGLSRAG